MSTSVQASQLDGLQSLCSALCPNAEAKLYTTNDTDDISSAVALDGTSYSALPAAFKYQKSFDRACTCKPANQTWVQALAQAEQLLDKGRASDVTVTEKISNDMARPSAAPAAPAGKPNKRSKKALLEAQSAAEGALGAQAPTSGGDSAGIASGAGSSTPIVRTGEGQIRQITGPDGAKRNVRIIAPAL